MKALMTAALLAVGLAQAAPTTYRNPVLPGFHPDPSICKVGQDFYLATSSFEYFPGVPIFHSRDLVNWRQVGHALTRPSQLPLAGQRSSRGIYAPTLRCNAGGFYLVTTNIDNGGNFYVHAKDPAGEWSEPVWLKEPAPWMDPSLLFDDDGQVYYTRHDGGERGGIVQARLDVKAGKLLDAPRRIWNGTGGVWPEGPHLYKVDGMYYLMVAEGGTSYEHMITVARAKTPWGPFESNPGNPVLSHRDRPDLPLQATGHGDLVQLDNGNWWMVLLGIRPQGGRHHHLGRETLLAPVTWRDGWPQVNGGKPLALAMSGAGLPRSQPWPAAPTRTDFDGNKLGLEWTHLRAPIPHLLSLAERRGMLRLKGSDDTLDDVAAPAFVARRQQHFNLRAAALLDFTPAAPGQTAGLVLRMNEANHYQLRVAGAPQRRVELVTRVKGVTTTVATAPLPRGPVELQIRAWPDRYEFGWRSGKGTMRTLGSAPTAALSSESAGGFTGVFVGMTASGKGAMPPADFDWFDYEALGD
ncbi:glycoside hydrolase family 43 protein [Pseudoduganella buxea]|uniref:Glycoside hydrolase 43 family protein n=2 Tax=Pseudoduganella buxea TaxID=1949069 RepID=A0ABQ1KKJ3_9BURK|nr:glycoside hydrolase family 43 protein [Pseudoduganella buxea]GGC03180.1 glycoside hydrolase 43 family protein [Pseudoduganella buxea]